MANRAAEAFRAGRIEEAEPLLRQSLSLSEETYEAHYWMGRLYATRAASSPAARDDAIASFSRALELQPYGDAGALAQAWLLKIGGRPRTLICAALPRQAAETMGGATFDAGNSAILARSLSSQAVDDFSPVLADANAFANSLRSLLDNRSAESQDAVSTPEKSALENALQGLCRSDSLRRLAPDVFSDNAAPTKTAGCGWLALVSVGEVPVTRQRQYKRVKDSDGKKRNVEISPTYSATANGTLWLYDPIGARLLPAQTLSAMSFFNSTSQNAARAALNDLAKQMNRRLKRLVALRPDPRLLDETLLPTALPGVYARSVSTSNEAAPPTSLFFASWNADNEDDLDLAKSVGDSVQYSLLAARFSVVSPNSARLAFKVLAGQKKGLASSEPFSPLVPDDATACLAARRIGCRYVVQGRLLPVTVQDKSFLIFGKVKVTARFELRVLDVQTGVVALSRTFDKSFKRSQFLGGNMEDKGLKVLPATLQTLSDEMSAALRGLLTSPTTTAPLSEPAVPVFPKPQPSPPPRYLPPEPNN